MPWTISHPQPMIKSACNKAELKGKNACRCLHLQQLFGASVFSVSRQRRSWRPLMNLSLLADQARPK